MSREAFRDRLIRSGYIEKFYETSVVPILRELAGIDNKLAALINDPKLKKELSDKQRETLNTALKNKQFTWLLNQVEKLNKKGLYSEIETLFRDREDKFSRIRNFLSDIERLFRVQFDYQKIYYTPGESLTAKCRPVDVVEFIAYEQNSGRKTAFPLKKFDDIREMDQQFLHNRYLLLKVDLTHEREDILQHCDEVVGKAQRAIGKTENKGVRGIDSDSLMKQDLFEYFFPNHAVKADKLEIALMKTLEDLTNCGITEIKKYISLQRRYYYNYSEKMRADSYSQLKKKLLAEANNDK